MYFNTGYYQLLTTIATPLWFVILHKIHFIKFWNADKPLWLLVDLNYDSVTISIAVIIRGWHPVVVTNSVHEAMAVLAYIKHWVYIHQVGSETPLIWHTFLKYMYSIIVKPLPNRQASKHKLKNLGLFAIYTFGQVIHTPAMTCNDLPYLSLY